MWSHFTVLNSPPFDDPLRLTEALKPMHVQALVPKHAVEAFDEAVVQWTSWSDEIKLDSSPVCPLIEVVTGEFSPVVHTE